MENFSVQSMTLSKLQLVDNCPVCAQLVTGVDAEVYSRDYYMLGEITPGMYTQVFYVFRPCMHKKMGTDKFTFSVYQFEETSEGKQAYNAKLYEQCTAADRARAEAGNTGSLPV